MQTTPRTRTVTLAAAVIAAASVLFVAAAPPRAAIGPSKKSAQAHASALRLNLDPAQTKIHFTLGATAHTVHGEFSLTRGQLSFDPSTGKVDGEIVVDARSGNSGNDGRDSKMHHDVLESASFPEIIFRPTRADGFSAGEGKLNGTVHGTLILHGSPHEVDVPVSVDLSGERWKATGNLSIPYVEWGLKNPSTFLLKVSKTVEIEMSIEGALVRVERFE